MATIAGPRPSWSFWVIAVLSLTWNAVGCLDFTMAVTRNPAYLAQLPADVVNWLDSAPTWTIAPWALGVWSALVGSLLLLARSRHAATAFALSLVGLAGNQLWQFSAGVPASMLGAANIAFTAAIWVVTIALLWFSTGQRVRGVLR